MGDETQEIVNFLTDERFEFAGSDFLFTPGEKHVGDPKSDAVQKDGVCRLESQEVFRILRRMKRRFQSTP